VKEVQIYTKTAHAWKRARFEAETKYLPSVYVARVSINLKRSVAQDDKELLQESLLLILDEKLKADFKRQLEDTEEKNGFLETNSLSRLSDKLSRYVARAVAAYPDCEWNSAID